MYPHSVIRIIGFTFIKALSALFVRFHIGKRFCQFCSLLLKVSFQKFNKEPIIQVLGTLNLEWVFRDELKHQFWDLRPSL